MNIIESIPPGLGLPLLVYPFDLSAPPHVRIIIDVEGIPVRDRRGRGVAFRFQIMTAFVPLDRVGRVFLDFREIKGLPAGEACKILAEEDAPLLRHGWRNGQRCQDEQKRPGSYEGAMSHVSHCR